MHEESEKVLERKVRFFLFFFYLFIFEKIIFNKHVEGVMASRDWDDGFREESTCWIKRGIEYFQNEGGDCHWETRTERKVFRDMKI